MNVARLLESLRFGRERKGNVARLAPCLDDDCDDDGAEYPNSEARGLINPTEPDSEAIAPPTPMADLRKS